MSPKNLSVPTKTHKNLLNKLKDKKIFHIYKKFESTLNLNQNFIVGVSGGPDSLALSFLAKIYSIKNFLNVDYYIVDHKLRQNSSLEVKLTRSLLKKYSIKLNILNWNSKKPTSNIQSIARKYRYKLLINAAKRSKVKNILTGHHLDDLYENFFIRILRGSGLNGLVSFGEKTNYEGYNLIRPLINIEKKELKYITNKIFNSFIEDPSNDDDKFTRVRVRKLIKYLKLDGLDKKKFLLTISNLKMSNDTIKYYTEKNLVENTSYFKKKNIIILKKDFFHQSDEVVFRSFMEIIRIVGKKFFSVRGKKLNNLIKLINYSHKTSQKVTLGNCIFKKVNNSIIVTKEQ